MAIKYNKDNTYKISAMTREEKKNYEHAIGCVRSSFRLGILAPRSVMEEYISPRDIIDGCSE